MVRPEPRVSGRRRCLGRSSGIVEQGRQRRAGQLAVPTRKLKFGPVQVGVTGAQHALEAQHAGRHRAQPGAQGVRIWQHTQPMVSAMVSPALACINSSSMLSAPKSLTSTASRWPPAWRNQWLSSVVLPAPGKTANHGQWQAFAGDCELNFLALRTPAPTTPCPRRAHPSAPSDRHPAGRLRARKNRRVCRIRRCQSDGRA